MLLSLALLVAFVAGVRADDKEVSLKGTITCAKCDLKLAAKCATVIKVTADGKDTIYYFDATGDKANHKKICTEAKEGTVTGTVSEKDGKHIITVSKVEFKE
jgi:hypothetical protein